MISRCVAELADAIEIDLATSRIRKALLRPSFTVQAGTFTQVCDRRDNSLLTPCRIAPSDQRSGIVQQITFVGA
jgi:hypothetical protein